MCVLDAHLKYDNVYIIHNAYKNTQMFKNMYRGKNEDSTIQWGSRHLGVKDLSLFFIYYTGISQSAN